MSKRKFLDTLNGLGVEVSRDVAEFLLALAAKNAKTLEEIEYGVLFAKQNKNWYYLFNNFFYLWVLQKGRGFGLGKYKFLYTGNVRQNEQIYRVA